MKVSKVIGNQIENKMSILKKTSEAFSGLDIQFFDEIYPHSLQIKINYE